MIWQELMEAIGDGYRLIAPDLPLHGGTPASPDQDFSLAGLARFVLGVADALGLGAFDLVANDTGGAVAQVLAAGAPERLRTLVLTNCDTQGNCPPEAFRPMVDLAAAGQLASVLAELLADPEAARSGVFGAGFERPEAALGLDAVEAFLEPETGTPESVRQFERLLVSAMREEDLKAIEPQLRTLRVPTLIAWGTDDVFFDLSWATWLAKSIPGAEEVVEVQGGRLFFPVERAVELAGHLTRFWSSH
jgi:pimeloyl-ACP methyl ester carboxylesterase